MSSVGRYSTNGLKRMITALNSIRFKDEIGEVEYFGQKVVMLRRDAFTLMKKELMRIGGAACNVTLSIAGRRVGSEEGKALLAKAESLGIKSPDSFSEFIRIAVEETNMGYGKVKVTQLDLQSGTVAVSLTNSFEAEEAGLSHKPSCIYSLSYLEGLFTQLIRRELKGKEVTCRAKGDKVCTFDLKAPMPEANPQSNR